MEILKKIHSFLKEFNREQESVSHFRTNYVCFEQFHQEPKAHVYAQVEVLGLSRHFTRVVDQLVKIGVRYLRRHLEIVIGPLTQILNGLLVQFAPDDLTAFLL